MADTSATTVPDSTMSVPSQDELAETAEKSFLLVKYILPQLISNDCSVPFLNNSSLCNLADAMFLTVPYITQQIIQRKHRYVEDYKSTCEFQLINNFDCSERFVCLRWLFENRIKPWYSKTALLSLDGSEVCKTYMHQKAKFYFTSAVLKQGRFSKAIWLATSFNLEAADMDDLGMCRFFSKFCGSAPLFFVEWYVAFFGVTLREDLLTETENALGNCARLNNLPVLEWLVSHFGITSWELLNRTDAVRQASRCGNVAILEWIINHYGIAVHHLSLHNILDFLEPALRRASVEQAQWLERVFKFADILPDGEKQRLSRIFTSGRYVNISSWFNKTYGLLM